MLDLNWININKVFILLIISIFINLIGCASFNKKNNTSSNKRNDSTSLYLLTKIRTVGSEKTLNELLYRPDKKWETFKAEVMNGDGVALDVLKELRKVSDAGYSTMLDQILSYSIATNTKGAFEIIEQLERDKEQPISFVERICGDTFENWIEDNELLKQKDVKASLTELKNRRSSVLSFPKSKMQERCLNGIISSERIWKNQLKEK